MCTGAQCSTTGLGEGGLHFLGQGLARGEGCAGGISYIEVGHIDSASTLDGEPILTACQYTTCMTSFCSGLVNGWVVGGRVAAPKSTSPTPPHPTTEQRRFPWSSNQQRTCLITCFWAVLIQSDGKCCRGRFGGLGFLSRKADAGLGLMFAEVWWLEARSTNGGWPGATTGEDSGVGQAAVRTYQQPLMSVESSCISSFTHQDLFPPYAFQCQVGLKQESFLNSGNTSLNHLTITPKALK